jgi:hypothetical protein
LAECLFYAIAAPLRFYTAKTQSEHPAAWVPVIPLLAFFASVFRARKPCGALPVRSVHLFYCMAEDSAIEAYKSAGLCLLRRRLRYG